MMLDSLGPYQLVRKLGRGGMGVVYEGVDVETGQRAALKVLSADLNEEEGFRQRFEVEIETLRRLKHPNIVRLFGFGQQEGILFYAMELVDGPSLEAELRRGRRFSWQEVVQLGIQICRGLRHAHDRGIIHRDLKPGNLLLASDGTLKLSDFGIARLFGGNRVTAVGSVVGTIEYMAPEQAQGGGVDVRADLYSLGGVLYAMLSGRPPLRARTLTEMLEKVYNTSPEPIRHYVADVPEPLEQLLEQLLEKKPSERIATAFIVARRLETLLPVGEESQHPNSPVAELQEQSIEEVVDGQQHSLSGLEIARPPEAVQAGVPHPSDQAPAFPRPAAGADKSLPSAGNAAAKASLLAPVHPGPSKAGVLQAGPGEPPAPDGSERPPGSDQAPAGSDVPAPLLGVDLPQAGMDLSGAVPPLDHALPGADVPSGEAPCVGQAQAGLELPETKPMTFPVRASPPVVGPSASLAGVGQGGEKNGEEFKPTQPGTPVGLAQPIPIVPEADLPPSPAQPVPLEGPHTVGESARPTHFTPVSEEELDQIPAEDSERPWISWQTWALAAALLTVGMTVWYLLQPPSADTLYQRILRISGEGSIETLRQAESSIQEFLTRYPTDPRTEQIRQLERELDLDRMERRFESQASGRLRLQHPLSPCERAYAEAIAIARTNPDLGIVKLQALLALYENRTDRSGPTGVCLELARRRLERLQEQVQPQTIGSLHLVEERLRRADELEKSSPATAQSIRQAVVELYADKPWAAGAVAQAKAALAAQAQENASGSNQGVPTKSESGTGPQSSRGSPSEKSSSQRK